MPVSLNDIFQSAREGKAKPMIKRGLFLFILLLMIPLFSAAQGARFDSVAQKNVQGFLAPIPGATITVCTAAATGTPCTPLVPTSPVTLCTDSTCAVAAANPFLADSNGNWGFWAIPGTYKVSITAAGVTGNLLTVVLPVTLTGNNNFTGPVTIGNGASMSAFTFSNHNGLTWGVAPAAVTIDQAVTGCTTLGVSSACISHIPPGYTGAESTNLLTTSTGYKVYTGSAIINDYRNNAVGLPPQYGITYGGRTGGALNRIGVVNYCHTPGDSCAGSNSWAQLDGTWPTNAGLLVGGVNLAMVHDAVTVGSSSSEVAATDSEVHMDATSADNPQFHASAYAGGVLLSRSGAAQDVIEANWAQAKSASITGGATGIIYYDYGFHAYIHSAGTYRNFGIINDGDSLYGNGTKLWAAVADTSVGVTATESGQTATFTMASNCAANPTFVAGALVGITGMSVSGYNGQFTILKAGCTGSSFTAFIPGSSGLAAGTGGTAQTTTPTPTTSFGVSGGNVITYQPLLDGSGWAWKTKAGTTIETLVSTGHGYNQALFSITPGNVPVGLASNPMAALNIGIAANNGYAFNPLTAAAFRTVNIPDPGTNVNLAFNLTATSAAFATATTAGTCVQNTTAVTGATTSMVATASPVSTPGVGAQWSAFVSSAGNVTINECAVATSAGGTIAFNIRVTP